MLLQFVDFETDLVLLGLLQDQISVDVGQVTIDVDGRAAKECRVLVDPNFSQVVSSVFDEVLGDRWGRVNTPGAQEQS